MKGYFLIVLIVLLCGAIALEVFGDCKGYFGDTAYAETSWSVGLPVKITKVVGLGVELSFMIKKALFVEYNCSCTPCCRSPSYQYAQLNLWGNAAAFGGGVEWDETLSGKRDGVPNPSSEEGCGIEITYSRSAETWFPAIGVGISVGGVGVSHRHVSMNFGAQHECECRRKTNKCENNRLPSFSDPSIEVDLVPGETRSFTVQVADPDKNLDRIIYMSNPNLRVKRVSHTINGESGCAKFTVSYQGSELLETHLEIEAWDKCGELKPLSIPVHIYHPPKLSLVKTRWNKYGNYEVGFRVDELILERCVQGWSYWNGGRE